MSGTRDWRVALGLFGLFGLSLGGCDRGQIEQLQAKLKEVQDHIAFFEKGRTNNLHLSFKPGTFELTPLPLVEPGEQLEVTVNWSSTSQDWDWNSIVLQDFTDCQDPPKTVNVTINTEPATEPSEPPTLMLTKEILQGSIAVRPGEGHRVCYELSYSGTVNGEQETWTIDPEWEHWP